MSEAGKWQEGSSFFEKKEAKKLLSVSSPSSRIVGSQSGEAKKPNNAKTQLRGPRPHQTDKSFLLLFFKKEDLAFLPLALPDPRR